MLTYKQVLLVLCFAVIAHADMRSAQTLKTLQDKFYDASNGLWKVGWWNSANALEALVEYTLYSKDDTFKSAIDNTFRHTTTAQTNNDAYDDAQWWAIAWVKAYQLTGNQAYMQRSVDIWNYILRVAWDDRCGGGVWWSAKKDYKNAITNELFFVLSTLLYQSDSTNNTYIEWAVKEWNWFEASGMINSKNLVNDGLNNCKNNGQQTWTYNQGVVLGGLANLYLHTKNNTLLDIAQKIADAVYGSSLVYSTGGVLREPCENAGCGPDGPQFKGVFMRYLGILTQQLQGSQRTKYITWIQTNSDSIWNKDRTPDDQCGLKWVGPADQVATATTQISALDCFNAGQLLSA